MEAETNEDQENLRGTNYDVEKVGRGGGTFGRKIKAKEIRGGVK